MRKFTEVLKFVDYVLESKTCFDKLVLAQDKDGEHYCFYIKKYINNWYDVPKDEYVEMNFKQGINEKVPEFISYRKIKE